MIVMPEGAILTDIPIVPTRLALPDGANRSSNSSSNAIISSAEAAVDSRLEAHVGASIPSRLAS